MRIKVLHPPNIDTHTLHLYDQVANWLAGRLKYSVHQQHQKMVGKEKNLSTPSQDGCHRYTQFGHCNANELNRVMSIVDGPCVFGLGCLFSIVVTWSVEIPYYSVPACCPGGSTMEQEQIMFSFASYYLNATVMAVWIAGVVWCH